MRTPAQNARYGCALLILTLLATCAAGCVTRAELAAQVQARRDYFEWSRPILERAAQDLRDPQAREVRLKTIEGEGWSITQAERALHPKESP